MLAMEYQLAKAKVNLALHVVSRRKNGFHELDSLVCFPNFGDKIICRKNSVPNLSISGNFKRNVPKVNNIIIKTLRKIPLANRNMSVHLEKNIPVSAGLGGGSADSAAVIRAYKNLWGEVLIAERDTFTLGADVPVCIDSSFQRMKGIGENVKKLKSTLSFYLLLVNSGDPISTKEVFLNLKFSNNPKLENLTSFRNMKDLVLYLKRQRNDLETAAFSINSNLEETKAYIGAQKGCKLARLSGSGGTIFGIFDNKIEAFEAYQKVKQENFFWWACCSPVSLANSRYDIAT